MNIIRIHLLLGLAVLIGSGCAGSTPQPMPIGPSSPVPMSGPVPVSGHVARHVVGPSETLWRISKTYGVDIDSILRANNLTDPNVLKTGQTLIIPNAHGPKPVIPLYPTNKWSHIVIHHTATDEGDAFSIDELHHKRGFWNGLGYHFLINNGTHGMSDGQIQVGPRWIKQLNGAHANAAGMNEKGIGISLVGNYSEEYVTQQELDSLIFLVHTLQDYYRIPARNVIRHSDVPGKNTECPGLKFPWSKFKQNLH